MDVGCVGEEQKCDKEASDLETQSRNTTGYLADPQKKCGVQIRRNESRLANTFYSFCTAYHYRNHELWTGHYCTGHRETHIHRHLCTRTWRQWTWLVRSGPIRRNLKHLLKLI